MVPSTIHAAWTLVAAFTLSFAYEIYRVTARAGTSSHDTPRAFVTQLVPFYLLAAALVTLLFRFGDTPWAASVGLIACMILILVSVGYYNPHVLPQRRPALVDWAEDLVYTGLLFVASAQFTYALHAAGMT